MTDELNTPVEAGADTEGAEATEEKGDEAEAPSEDAGDKETAKAGV